MKRYFHEELEDVRSNLMLMGEKSVEITNSAMKAMLEGDQVLAEKIIKSDDVINDIETQIDDEVARYISLRAPVARDLRLLFVAVKASHDLERVGDEASNVAKRTIKILTEGPIGPSLGQVPKMGELAVSMLKEALQSFIQEDENIAYSIINRDKEVDSLNRENFSQFVELMKQDPSTVATCTEMVFVSKSFERIADHAKNIAEEVYYLLTSQSLKEVIRAEKQIQ
jgi:phosphate transport system protein